MHCIHNHFNLKAIAIIICLILSAPAYAGGFFFNREQFIKDIRIDLKISGKDITPLPKIVIDEKINIRAELEIHLLSSVGENKDSMAVINKESKFKRFKISISQINEFSPGGDNIYSGNDEKIISKIIEKMPALFHGDSKVQSLETMGKLVEPQINIYFEF